MSRRWLLLGAATLPLFLLAMVLQAVQYQDLKRDVSAKERQQADWIERNTKVQAGITVLSSPSRIEALAVQDPTLQSVGADRTVKLRFQTPAEAGKP